jgi:tRNA1Val (adenine37-N6)-methyltransferase
MSKQADAPDLIDQFADETLEDLQRGGLRILQKKCGFRFGLDSVLLAAFAAGFFDGTPHRALRIADLGAGAGAVALLLAARLENARIAALELDLESAGLLRRNIWLNKLADRLEAVSGDIRDLAAGSLASPFLPAAAFDMVVSNPPYQRPGAIEPKEPVGDSEKSNHDSKKQAIAETALSLQALFQAASRLLKPRGRLVIVHQSSRLAEIMDRLLANGLAPKALRFVQPGPDAAPKTFLLLAVKQGKTAGLRVDPPLILYSQPGVCSPHVKKIYGSDPPLAPAALRRGIRYVPGETEELKTEEAGKHG